MQARDARYGIASLAASSTALEVNWADGHCSRFPSIWLLQACSCASCGSSESAVRHVKLTEQPARPEILSARRLDDELEIDWGARHVSRFPTAWLRDHCLSPSERSRRRPKPRLWSAEIATDLPYLSYRAVAEDPQQHLDFLETLRDIGFVILRDVPAERARTEEVAGLSAISV